MKKTFLLVILSLQFTHANEMCDSSMIGELEACTKRNLFESDKQLNDAYKYIMQNLSTPKKEQLKKIQISWIKHKESTCNYTPSNNGSEYFIERNICLNNATEERIRELSIIKNQISKNYNPIYAEIPYTRKDEDPAWNDFVDLHCSFMMDIFNDLMCKQRNISLHK